MKYESLIIAVQVDVIDPGKGDDVHEMRARDVHLADTCFIVEGFYVERAR